MGASASSRKIIQRDSLLITLEILLNNLLIFNNDRKIADKFKREEVENLLIEIRGITNRYNRGTFVGEIDKMNRRKKELLKSLIYSVNYIKLQYKFDFPKGSAEAKFASSSLFYGLSALKLQETGAKFCDYTTKLLPNFNEQGRVIQEIANIQNNLAELRKLTEAATKAKSEKMVASKEWIKTRETMIAKIHRYFLWAKFEYMDDPVLSKMFSITKNFYPKKRKSKTAPEPEMTEESIETNEA